MIRAALALLTLANFGLAVLLVAVSGFVFGHGPESGHYGPLFNTAFIAFIVLCVVAPIFAFIVQARGKTGLAFALVLGPLIGALLVSTVPAP